MQVLLSLVQDSTVLLWGMVTLVNLIEVANSRGLDTSLQVDYSR